MYNLLAICVGFLLTLMTALNTGLSNYVSLPLILVIFHFSAAVICFIFILGARQELKFNANLPSLFYLGGAIGFFSVLLNSVCMSKMGASLTAAIVIFGQMLTSAVIDNFGLFRMPVRKFNFKKILGFGVISIGLALMVYGS